MASRYPSQYKDFCLFLHTPGSMTDVMATKVITINRHENAESELCPHVADNLTKTTVLIGYLGILFQVACHKNHLFFV